MRTIRFGGQLEKGDFIAISYSNYIQFGWYVGSGASTIQFYGYNAPNNFSISYDRFLKELKPSKWQIARFGAGLTLKGIHKDYVYDNGPHRICKINPKDIFTDPEEKEIFEKSEDILIKLKFLNQ